MKKNILPGERPRIRQARRFFNVERLDPRIVLDSTVVFNEIMYHPADSGNANLEFIEFHNQLAVDMDISQWRVAGGVNYRFPDHTIVPGRGQILIAADPKSLEEVHTLSHVMGPWAGRLNNGGETLQLFNNDQRLMNEVTFDDTGDWSGAADGGGLSLAKKNQQSASHLVENWTFSRQLGGTPGVPNLAGSSTEASLRFNEIAAASDENFYVEIINRSRSVTDLDGLVISVPGERASDYVFSTQTLGPGDRVAVYDSQWSFQPHLGDHMFLYSTGKEMVLDARQVSARLQGFEETTGIWQYPVLATPSKSNLFDVERDVVINEVMYHAPTTPGDLDTPPIFVRTEILPLDWGAWRYNQSGTDLGPDWHNTVYSVDNRNWFSGPAPIGVAFSPSPVPINTDLIAPRENDSQFVTHLFQTEFELSEDKFDRADFVELVQFIDDGALTYINGQEVSRINLPYGDIDFETRAVRSIRGLDMVDPVLVPKELLRIGTNFLSVEVHQDSANSRDIVMGTRIAFGEQIAEAIPGKEAVDNSEEWIELYNRGIQPVDLTGWRIRDAVDFDFASGATIEPGQYLVIARDSSELREKYPDVDITGDFQQSLGNRDDRIRLVDAFGNLADDVHYYEGGRWPSVADGGAASLELRNPWADNSKAEAWSASDNSYQSEWITHTRRGTADVDMAGVLPAFHEFVLGMLDSGDILLDDVRVVQYPQGDTVSLIQNGTFEEDIVGEPPAKWRIIGNHSGRVIIDPTDSNNKVLHLTAKGAQAFVHDHAESTFADGVEIISGMGYEVSFRAKWLSGNSQLHSRLFYNRLAKVVNLQLPSDLGTPGAKNSSFETNIGPTFSDFGQDITTPDAGVAVTVSVQAHDPDGIERVDLWWREDGGRWLQSCMIADSWNVYRAQIPGHESGTIVQFYVSAIDTLGLSASYPSGGPDSRALLQVADGQGPLTSIDTIRILIMKSDQDALNAREDRMSNAFVPITLVHNETSFYDVDVRQVGSTFNRPDSGYKIRLHPDEPFYGVHDSIRLDLSGLHEIVVKQMVNRAGGSQTSLYDDITYLIVPDHGVIQHHSQEALLQLARYENVYLEEQFENGSSGTKWKLEWPVFPSGPSGNDPEGLKRQTTHISTVDIGVSRDITAIQGGDSEFYRPQLLIKNNRVEDRFGSIREFAQAIHTNSDSLFDATNRVMDVDIWMRHYATQAYLGNWDTYGIGNPRNVRLYQRPEDGKIVPLFWDSDAFPYGESIYVESIPASRLDEIRDIPHNLRLFWGHMWDLINRSFNENYVSTWAAHYGELAAADFQRVAELTGQRSEAAIAQIKQAIPEVDFQITTADGFELNPGGNSILLEGKGWVNIRHIRVADGVLMYDANSCNPSPENLDRLASLQSKRCFPTVDKQTVGAGMSTVSTVRRRGGNVFWPKVDTWQIQLPMTTGAQGITLEAIDFEGNLIGSDTVRFANPAPRPVISEFLASNDDGLRDADGESSDWIEIFNPGDQVIDLEGWHLTDNDSRLTKWTFPSTILQPQQQLIVFASSCTVPGHDCPAASTELHTNFSLSAGGEYLALVQPDGVEIASEFGSGDSDYPRQFEDISYGLSSEGGNIRYFPQPTPGHSNENGFLGFVSATRFSVDRGFFDRPFDVTVSSDTPGATVIYTTDGSLPASGNGVEIRAVDENSLPSAVITVETTTYLRAIAVKNGFLPTNVDTQSYIFLDDVIRQDALSNPLAVDLPTTWQGGAAADYEMDVDVIDQWHDTDSDDDEFRIQESFTSIPTISIVMNHGDLWGEKGIYTNSDLVGDEFRRPGSIEFFDPQSGESFQTNAGVQIHGGASRLNSRLKKHSFRLLFRDEFGGPDSLRVPLFKDSNIDEFNTLVLRASFTDAFGTATAPDRYNPLDSVYLRDIWMKDTQLAMGHLSGHNTYVHLYINGLYWGLYNPTERPDDAFLSSYLGGQRADWDVIKDFNELFRGNTTAWDEMFALAEQIPTSFDRDAVYHRLRGNNPDGSPNPDFPNYLDMENLIDYMILHQYAGAEDWPHHNWYAARNRVDPGNGFQFFVWDQEIVLDGRFRNLTDTGTHPDHRFTPAGLYHSLRNSAAFRLHYADRIQKHFSQGGALSTEVSQQRWMTRANEIETAIIAESARWGDARKGETVRVDSDGPLVIVPKLTVDTWRAERDKVHDNYFSGIHSRYLQYFADEELLPPLGAPLFNRQGGVVPPGFRVVMNSVVNKPFFGVQVHLPEFSPATAFVPLDDKLDATNRGSPAWTLPGFNDSSWLIGNGGVGFERRSGSPLEPFVGLDLWDLPAGQGTDPDKDGAANSSSFYTRFEFTVHDDLQFGDFDQMLLMMRYDDGFVAYLNGFEIARTDSLPQMPRWNSIAGMRHDARDIGTFDVTPHTHRLRIGETNVLAIHALNESLRSTDILVSPTLTIGSQPDGMPVVYYTVDGSDPHTADGMVSPSALRFDGNLRLDASITINARSLLANVWSALQEAVFLIDPRVLTETDFNGDQTIDADDIDLLSAQLRSPTADLAFDLNGDDRVNLSDLDMLIQDVIGTHHGDTDLNGTVDSLDFASLAANFGTSVGTWGRGDSDGDGDVDFRDFTRLSNNFS